MVLLSAGTLIVVASALGAVLMRSFYDRMHFLTPVTSLGAPLIGLALAVQDGATLTTALILFIVALLAVSGPVLTAATGRMAAQLEGIVRTDEPQ
jgi:multisubunit Na+/H+ antiporter MnhG subunit